MSKVEKTLERVQLGYSDANIDFAELRRLLDRPEFVERIRGGHFIFTKDGVEEILNLQPKGSNAKAYQVKQVRNMILKYRLRLQDD